MNGPARATGAPQDVDLLVAQCVLLSQDVLDVGLVTLRLIGKHGGGEDPVAAPVASPAGYRRSSS